MGGETGHTGQDMTCSHTPGQDDALWVAWVVGGCGHRRRRIITEALEKRFVLIINEMVGLSDNFTNSG